MRELSVRKPLRVIVAFSACLMGLALGLAPRAALAQLPPAPVRLFVPDSTGKVVEVVSPFAEPDGKNDDAISESAAKLAELFQQAGDGIQVSGDKEGFVTVELWNGKFLASLQIELDALPKLKSNDKAGISVSNTSKDGAFSISFCTPTLFGCKVCVQIHDHGPGTPTEINITTFCNGEARHHVYCPDIRNPFHWECPW